MSDVEKATVHSILGHYYYKLLLQMTACLALSCMADSSYRLLLAGYHDDQYHETKHDQAQVVDTKPSYYIQLRSNLVLE